MDCVIFAADPPRAFPVYRCPIKGCPVVSRFKLGEHAQCPIHLEGEES